MIYSNSIMYNDKRMQSHPCCFFFSLICVTMSLLLKSSKQRSLILVGMPSIVLLCRDQDEAELLMINGEVLAHSLLYLSLSLSSSLVFLHLLCSSWSFLSISLSLFLFFVVISLPLSGLSLCHLCSSWSSLSLSLSVIVSLSLYVLRVSLSFLLLRVFD